MATGLSLVPQSGQTLAQTRQPILQNFTDIQNQFAVNHVQYNDPSGFAGEHNKVSFVQQTSVAPVINKVLLYNLLDATTGQNELYMSRSTAAAFPITEMAAGSTSSTGSSRGWTYLPSGMIIKFRKVTASGNNFTVDFNTGKAAGEPSFGNALLCATITPLGASNCSYAVSTIQVSGATAIVAGTVSVSGAVVGIIACGI